MERRNHPRVGQSINLVRVSQHVSYNNLNDVGFCNSENCHLALRLISGIKKCFLRFERKLAILGILQRVLIHHMTLGSNQNETLGQSITLASASRNDGELPQPPHLDLNIQRSRRNGLTNISWGYWSWGQEQSHEHQRLYNGKWNSHGRLYSLSFPVT